MSELYLAGGTQAPTAGQMTTSVASSMSDNSRVPARAYAGDKLWVRVIKNGTGVTASCADSENGLDSAQPCAIFNNGFTYNDGGYIGFGNGYCYSGDLTVRSFTGGTAGAIQAKEDFQISPILNSPTYDAAGNMTFDGMYRYSYDAWNRLVKVSRAYVTGGTLQSGDDIGTISYDGLGRRTKKVVTNSGDWTYTYNYYYDGQRVIEERNDSNRIIRQTVWGQQYVDELVQIGINQAVRACDGKCQRFFYACQDANYNVLGMLSAGGDLTERYEYTPYGQRTVYSHGWMMEDVNDDGIVDVVDYGIVSSDWGSHDLTGRRSDINGDGYTDVLDLGIIATAWQKHLPYNDIKTMYPTLESTRGKQGGNTSYLPFGLCEFGYQGLQGNKEFGDVYVNGVRYLNVSLGRYMTNDPTGYPDGMNRYESRRSSPVTGMDPTGLFHTGEHISITKAAWTATKLTFQQSGAMTDDYLTVMIKNNWNTDYFHTFTPSYHAQDIAFVQLVKERMDSIKNRTCWKNWAWISGDWATLNDMGTALHILQDIYAHTDWVDGTDMDAVYKAYGDATRGKNKPNKGTVSLAKLENGNNAEFTNTIFYTGGTNPLADDSHNRYAADTKTYGRASGPLDQNGKQIGLGVKAYNDADKLATATSKEFIIWAKDNMTKCCCEILFGVGNCNGNKQ